MTDQAVMTMYLVFIGEIPSEPEPTMTKGLTRGPRGSREDPPEHFQLPTYLGVDTNTLADVLACMQWGLETQEGEFLPFTLNIEKLNAFPLRSMVQAVDLTKEDPATHEHYDFNTVLTPKFVNTDLVLSSRLPHTVPEHLKQVYDALVSQKHQRCNFMLLTKEQLQTLTTRKMLGKAMIAQDDGLQEYAWKQHHGNFWWCMNPVDQYWGNFTATPEDCVKQCLWLDHKTFQIRHEISAEVTAAATTANDTSTTANDTHVLRVHHRHTPGAGTEPSTTWRYEENGGNQQAMPAVDNTKTQVFFFCFNIFARKIPPLEISRECPICNERKDELVAAACGHGFCSTCVATVEDASRNVKCPFCRAENSRDDMVSVQFPTETQEETGESSAPLSAWQERYPGVLEPTDPRQSQELLRWRAEHRGVFETLTWDARIRLQLHLEFPETWGAAASGVQQAQITFDAEAGAGASGSSAGAGASGSSAGAGASGSSGVQYDLCTICQCEFDGEERVSLPCCHEFHDHCITQWFDSQKTCPVCRQTGVRKRKISPASSPGDSREGDSKENPMVLGSP